MFEVPDWAECSAANVPGLPLCHRSVAKMITVMMPEKTGVGLESLGACNRHVEVVEAHLGSLSELPPITVPKAQFPALIDDLLGSEA
jgi:hypothetical protein